MNWISLAPEIVVLAAALWFLALSLMTRPDAVRDRLSSLILAALGVAASLASLHCSGSFFASAYRVDLFSQVFKVMLSLGLLVVAGFCGELTDINERNRHDFYLLLFICTLAMMMLVSATHFIAIYVSLELSSYSLYILAALRKDRDLGVEAGIKYFIVGIFASAIMLFGLALLYGTAQIASLDDIVRACPEILGRPAVATGLLLVFSGFFFKLAAFPFHYWAPDVYQGAANLVAAFIATASKVAAIAVIVRLVSSVTQTGPFLVHVLAFISVASMTIGNLAAIVQKDLKRLLAYSTVAHAGYVLIGILSMNPAGYAAAVFYAFGLLVMKSAAFLVVIIVACDGANVSVQQLAGLHRRSPILALTLMVSLFSLAGIPPTIGFAGKFLVFVAAMERGYFILVLIGMINVVISLYYYLLAIKAAYFLEPEEELPALSVSSPIRLLAGVLIGLMVAAGFYPTSLIELANAAVRSLM